MHPNPHRGSVSLLVITGCAVAIVATAINAAAGTVLAAMMGLVWLVKALSAVELHEETPELAEPVNGTDRKLKPPAA